MIRDYFGRIAHRTPRPPAISDDAMVAFVWWCRLNDEDVVGNPDVARRVLHAYSVSVVS